MDQQSVKPPVEGFTKIISIQSYDNSVFSKFGAQRGALLHEHLRKFARDKRYRPRQQHGGRIDKNAAHEGVARPAVAHAYNVAPDASQKVMDAVDAEAVFGEELKHGERGGRQPVERQYIQQHKGEHRVDQDVKTRVAEAVFGRGDTDHI